MRTCTLQSWETGFVTGDGFAVEATPGEAAGLAEAMTGAPQFGEALANALGRIGSGNSDIAYVVLKIARPADGD